MKLIKNKKLIITWSLILLIQALFFAAIFGTKGFTSSHDKSWLDNLVVLIFAPQGIIGGFLGEQIPKECNFRSFWVYCLVFVGAIPASWVYAKVIMGIVRIIRRNK